MNLYRPNALMDSPYGPTDLEWLYRSQDVDGPSLLSRLADLAPISFTNTIDGQRRRRLFAVESWELNNFVWTNDNPGNAFPNNTSFSPSFTGTLTSGSNTVTGITYTRLSPGQTIGGNGILPGTTILSVAAGSITLSANATVTGTEQLNVLNQNASFAQLGVNQNATLPTPALAHRDKKINLNYPLPVSNDPNEPIRQKWISETYQLLKAILPPLAVDTPEELAQLSQFVINIIDFRDPDCTMTHWQNPDVTMAVWNGTGPALAPVLILSGAAPPTNMAVASTATPPVLDQYGMEYNPVALNEVLAFSYAHQGVGSQANRFFVELVNTLTQSAFAAPSQSPGGTNPPDPSILDLGGFQYTPGDDPYSGGCWDLVFTEDTPNSRPDPYRGELVQGGQFYALIPLIKDSFTASPAGAAAGSSSKPGSDVTLVPLWAAAVPSPSVGNPAASPPTPPNFFYAFGNSPANPAFETGTPSPTTYYPFPIATGSQPTPRRWCNTSAPRPTRSIGARPRRSPGIPACCRGSSRTPTPPRAPRRPAISRSSPP